ncbi:hypothetical protein NPIL_188391 [Nephila pilipes]|uniref:Uncharacterized protein n=1 Tax=Nephila pilipes TaxID=299642 RepID=A0A8X6PRT1_NEPPI|nr:hypothetical protein NPIL_188391 [Nephila pilipes]
MAPRRRRTKIERHGDAVHGRRQMPSPRLCPCHVAAAFSTPNAHPSIHRPVHHAHEPPHTPTPTLNPSPSMPARCPACSYSPQQNKRRCYEEGGLPVQETRLRVYMARRRSPHANGHSKDTGTTAHHAGVAHFKFYSLHSFFYLLHLLYLIQFPYA